MSLETWKKEYYPIPADDPSLKGQPVACIQHSLTKWKGLRPENLEKHEVTDLLGDRCIKFGNNTLWIDGSSCSLCCNYTCDMVGLDGGTQECPIQKISGDHCGSAYRCKAQLVEPVISLLEQTLEVYECTDLKLLEIHESQAKYVRDSGYSVEVKPAFSEVSMQHSEDTDCGVFLQGHEADEFLSQADRIYEELHMITMDDVIHSLAKPYIDNL